MYKYSVVVLHRRLLKNGMSFTNFYSAPLCAMGRAEFLTGRSWTRTGNLFNA
jgi:arylsulfatase A-like enzyme